MRGINRVSQLSDVRAHGGGMFWELLSRRPPQIAVLIAYKPRSRNMGGWGPRGFRSYQT